MTYADALTYLIENEGTTFTDNALDKGGPTKYGVTISVLSGYLGRAATIDDVKNLDYPTISDLYHKLYWIPLYADELPYPIACALFDQAVNRGQRIAVGLAQNVIPGLHEDGIIGEETIEALKRTDVDMFIYNYVGALQNSYIELCLHAPSQMAFLKGWMKRARRLFLLVDHE